MAGATVAVEETDILEEDCFQEMPKAEMDTANIIQSNRSFPLCNLNKLRQMYHPRLNTTRPMVKTLDRITTSHNGPQMQRNFRCLPMSIRAPLYLDNCLHGHKWYLQLLRRLCFKVLIWRAFTKIRAYSRHFTCCNRYSIIQHQTA